MSALASCAGIATHSMENAEASGTRYASKENVSVGRFRLNAEL
jgi:hypothetical protein